MLRDTCTEDSNNVLLGEGQIRIEQYGDLFMKFTENDDFWKGFYKLLFGSRDSRQLLNEII